uniref:Uncharacterized protein n=1 Tax=Vibrio tasmaniensis TaxID=212663 RepID=A0A0H4A0M8_9VIBR|nr:hypothetical protein [Vibrio tasmaniensis]PMI58298.1 hypothetical protein BCU41_03960 [Vibrio lentus]
MQAAINAAFARSWQIGTVETPCRYRFKDGIHTLKTFSGLLDKGVVCTHPDGQKFEVVSSKQVLVSTFEHTLQFLNQTPAHNWTPPR